jgi:hypothetical protein
LDLLVDFIFEIGEAVFISLMTLPRLRATSGIRFGPKTHYQNDDDQKNLTRTETKK